MTYVVCTACGKWAVSRGWLERLGIGHCKCGGTLKSATHPPEPPRRPL